MKKKRKQAKRYKMKEELKIPEWLDKCMTCKHCYTTRDTGDLEYKCRCRDGKCHYEKYKK